MNQRAIVDHTPDPSWRGERIRHKPRRRPAHRRAAAVVGAGVHILLAHTIDPVLAATYATAACVEDWGSLGLRFTRERWLDYWDHYYHRL